MASAQSIPLLLYLLAGLLLGLLAWGLWRNRRSEFGEALMEPSDNLLLWLAVLAAFALGAFLTYIFLDFHP